MRASFSAMGTTFVIDVESSRALSQVQRKVEGWEALFSRFRPESELSRLNLAGQGHVSEPMAEVLGCAHQLHAQTAGKFDVAVGEAVIGWGYDRTFDDVETLALVPRSIRQGAWSLTDRFCELSGRTQLDLGGLVKGWVADQIVEAGLASMVSAGGDVRSADQNLIVDVQSPGGATVAAVAVGVGALATSSTARRQWLVGSHKAHHLVDPATMKPAVVPSHTVSVVAQTAVEAEAAAKAVLLMGATGLEWAAQQPWIRQAVAQWNDGLVYSTARRQAA